MQTYTYYIYHIPGVKVGCTNELENRMADQGFTEWEILETHEDGWLAGDREIELQKEYGYRVDTIHYMISRENRSKWNDQTRHPLTKEECALGGKTTGSKPKSEEWKSKMDFGGNFNNKRVVCEVCDSKPMNAGNYIRWGHGPNCTKKKKG